MAHRTSIGNDRTAETQGVIRIKKIKAVEMGKAGGSESANEREGVKYLAKGQT